MGDVRRHPSTFRSPGAYPPVPGPPEPLRSLLSLCGGLPSLQEGLEGSPDAKRRSPGALWRLCHPLPRDCEISQTSTLVRGFCLERLQRLCCKLKGDESSLCRAFSRGLSKPSRYLRRIKRTLPSSPVIPANLLGSPEGSPSPPDISGDF